MHLCDNPPCVRPDHLRLGSILDNNRDMTTKKRGRVFGARPKLTAEQVIEARRRHERGESLRSIGRTLGVQHQAIGQAVRRITWDWLD